MLGRMFFFQLALVSRSIRIPKNQGHCHWHTRFQALSKSDHKNSNFTLIFQIIRIWFGWNKIWIFFRELKGSILFTTYVLMTKLVCSKGGGLLLMFMTSVLGVFTQKSFFQHLETMRKIEEKIDRLLHPSKVNMPYIIFHNLFLSLFFYLNNWVFSKINHYYGRRPVICVSK